MSKEIVIGTAHSKGPGVSKGVLRIADAPDGSPLEAPVIIVQGSGDGPVVWMHGCVHGNEYCGTYIIHDFVRSLDPSTLKGTVVALPVLNVSAFQTKRRMSPYEGYNGGDLNRQFPGDKGGTLTQQMAHALFEPLQRYADVLIDFHTALTPDVRWALFPKVDGKAGEISERVARAFGYRDTLPTPDTILSGSAMMTAAKVGIASFIVECGGKNRAFTDESVADAVDRLHNVLRALAMEPGPVKDYGPMTFFSEIRAQRRGVPSRASSSRFIPARSWRPAKRSSISVSIQGPLEHGRERPGQDLGRNGSFRTRPGHDRRTRPGSPHRCPGGSTCDDRMRREPRTRSLGSGGDPRRGGRRDPRHFPLPRRTGSRYDDRLDRRDPRREPAGVPIADAKLA
jgi:predicted deacylase